jgi:putative cardiolipin synthase
MHNKLFVADNALAILGGHNLADEYFLGGKDANFLDIDLLAAGAIVPQASEVFDQYRNSEQAFPLAALGQSRHQEELRGRFTARVEVPASTPWIDPADGLDLMGQPAFSRAMAQGHHRFVVADARIVADDPAKAGSDGGGSAAFERSMTARYFETVRTAR